jgi:hypothetical protein
MFKINPDYGNGLSMNFCLINKSVPTKRAPDGWESPRFQAVFWLKAGSVKVAFSYPAHPRVTLPVSLPFREEKTNSH